MSAVKSGGPSYSPGRPSPVSASPQRAELSPAAKSPLLGPAPPGLLPPPDKSVYSSVLDPTLLLVLYIYMTVFAQYSVYNIISGECVNLLLTLHRLW